MGRILIFFLMLALSSCGAKKNFSQEEKSDSTGVVASKSIRVNERVTIIGANALDMIDMLRGDEQMAWFGDSLRGCHFAASNEPTSTGDARSPRKLTPLARDDNGPPIVVVEREFVKQEMVDSVCVTKQQHHDEEINEGSKSSAGSWWMWAVGALIVLALLRR